ncbi:MAG: hypothetical protein K2G83_06335 [Ruminococcus sp.]|nr:hypothetical protein [Ruminococcus sp.]
MKDKLWLDVYQKDEHVYIKKGHVYHGLKMSHTVSTSKPALTTLLRFGERDDITVISFKEIFEDLSSCYVVYNKKDIAQWCLNNIDATRHLFEKHGVDVSSDINESFDMLGICRDIKWGLLLDDIIQHSEFIRTESF